MWRERAAMSTPRPDGAVASAAPSSSCTNRDEWVGRTAKLSLCAQLLFGAVSCAGLLVDTDAVLRDLLLVDIAVQVIELTFYAVLLYKGGLPVIVRYADWVFSTPLMIVSLLVFLEYLHDPSTSFSSFFSERWPETAGIVALNQAMLGCGIALERRGTDARLVLAGFAFFVACYGWIFAAFVRDALGAALVAVVFLVWSGYGAVAFRSDATRQIAYNVLDIVSKNVYGAAVAIYAIA